MDTFAPELSCPIMLAEHFDICPLHGVLFRINLITPGDISSELNNCTSLGGEPEYEYPGLDAEISRYRLVPPLTVAIKVEPGDEFNNELDVFISNAAMGAVVKLQLTSNPVPAREPTARAVYVVAAASGARGTKKANDLNDTPVSVLAVIALPVTGIPLSSESVNVLTDKLCDIAPILTG